MRKSTNLLGQLILLVLLFCSVPLVRAQEVVSVEEVEAWLRENSVDSTEVLAAVDSMIIADGLHVAEGDVEGDTVMGEKLSLWKTSKDLLTEIDKESIAEEARLLATQNPMFVDLVFRYPDRTVSMQLADNDSTVKMLRSGLKKELRLTEAESYTIHVDDLPNIQEIMSISKVAKLKPVEVEPEVAPTTTIEMEKKKESFWKFGGSFSVQASQNYISSNWYKGGESNLAGIVDLDGFANYDNKDNIQWDNKAELDFGINSAGSDSLRPFRVNQDLFKVTSKLGIKAFKNFFYTAEGEFSTQLFNTYVPNTYERVTAPLSPIRTYLSVGMDYKYKGMLSVFLSPVSYKFVYVNDTSVRDGVDPSLNIARKFGIDPGKQTLHQVGGLLKVTFKHTFVDVIGLESDLLVYTNYSGVRNGVEIDWKITANFLLNRYFSARVMLHPRFDNITVLPDGEKPKIQFNELISLGFNYKI